MPDHHPANTTAQRGTAEFFAATDESRRNLRQILLFCLLTILLTAASVYAIRYFYFRPTELIFLVDKEDSVQGRFAARLAKLTLDTSKVMHIKIIATGDDAASAARIERQQGDLLITRSDALPAKHARALAILDHQVLVMLQAKSRSQSLTDLKGAKIFTLDSSGATEKFLRKLLSTAGVETANLTIAAASPSDNFGKMLGSGGYNAFATFETLSRIDGHTAILEIAKRSGGAAMIAVDDSKALEKRVTGWFDETIEANSLSAAQSLPAEDTSSVGVQWLLLARDKVSVATISDLTTEIFENKSALGLDDEFATHIEPANTDKDAILAVHPGALEYFNDNTKSFLERYSDIVYLVGAVGGIIASAFTALYTFVTYRPPVRTADVAPLVLAMTADIAKATTLSELDAIEANFQQLLHKTVSGMSDGTIQTEGAHAFTISSGNFRALMQKKHAELAGKRG